MTAVREGRQHAKAEKSTTDGGSGDDETQQISWFKRYWKGVGGMTLATLAAGAGMYGIYRIGDSNTQQAIENGNKTAAAKAAEATKTATVAGLMREFGVLGFNVTHPGNDEIKIVAVSDGFDAVAVDPKLADQLTEKVGNPYSASAAAPPDLQATQVHEVINGLTGAVENQSAAQVVTIRTPNDYETLVASVVGTTSVGSPVTK